MSMNTLGTNLQAMMHTPSSTTALAVSFIAAAILLIFGSQLSLIWTFMWNCFFQPLGKNADQAGRLDRFYSGQADSKSTAFSSFRPPTSSRSQQVCFSHLLATHGAVYDKTRSHLLRGRGTMLKLSAAHLKEQRRKDPTKRLVWLDIGGGTGESLFLTRLHAHDTNASRL